MNTPVPDRSIESDVTPPDGPSDSLGKFLDAASLNTLATIAILRPQYATLASIYKVYCDMIDNLNQSPEFVAGLFLIRTHSSFRGAARLAVSGQTAETYMVLRGCLESAWYGLYVATDSNRQQILIRRHDDDASRRRVRKEFTIRNVFNQLQSIDNRTHDIAESLYERTIDLGK